MSHDGQQQIQNQIQIELSPREALIRQIGLIEGQMQALSAQRLDLMQQLAQAGPDRKQHDESDRHSARQKTNPVEK